MRTNTFCAGCFSAVGNVFIKCSLCSKHFHQKCSGVNNDRDFKFLNTSKNAVYKCNQCAKESSDLIAKVSMLSNEIKELKAEFQAYKNKNNKIESVSFLNKKTYAETSFAEKKNVQKSGQSTFCNSFSSNSAKCNLSNGNDVVVADAHDVDCLNANVVAAEPKDPSLNVLRARIRRESICLSEKSDDTDTVATANSQAESDIPVSNSEWIDVKPKIKRKHFVFGNNNNKDLDVFDHKKWVHLSSFKPNVTVEQVKEYIAKYANINKINIQCYKLVKNGADMNVLKSISFKVGVSMEFYKELLKPSLWPANVRVRPFYISHKS